MATLNTTWLKRKINNIITKTFAISHVKSTYYNYEENKMLDDVLIETEDFDQSAVTESEISPVILTKINAVAEQTSNNFTLLNANKAESTDVYTRAETDNLISALKQDCDWKESVDTYDDISTTYPNPEDGWTVTVKDTNVTYRYNGTNWVDIYTLAQLATESNDGLMSKENYSKLSKAESDLADVIPRLASVEEEVEQINSNLSVIGKCKNLLKPTLQTTTKNGVTCTNNGDGTYTLNGTASDSTVFILAGISLDSSCSSYKLTGCPLGGDWNNGYSMYAEYQYWGVDVGKGAKINLVDASSGCWTYIRICKNTVCNNLVFKPMITKDLSVTYDDFVPYTGYGETLTADVAEIKNDLIYEDITVDSMTYSYLQRNVVSIQQKDGYEPMSVVIIDGSADYTNFIASVSKGYVSLTNIYNGNIIISFKVRIYYKRN